MNKTPKKLTIQGNLFGGQFFDKTNFLAKAGSNISSNMGRKTFYYYAATIRSTSKHLRGSLNVL